MVNDVFEGELVKRKVLQVEGANGDGAEKGSTVNTEPTRRVKGLLHGIAGHLPGLVERNDDHKRVERGVQKEPRSLLPSFGADATCFHREER